MTQRRLEFPVVYIPLGTLEWHGLHNPMGADGLQAETLTIRCAKKGGGLVFPTVYYGESRAGSLLETDPKFRKGVAERMGIPVEGLLEERQPYSSSQQIEHYCHHLVHILAEAASYHFSLAVFVVGHYPLLDHARAAILFYNQWCYDKPWKHMGAWAFADFQVLKGIYENPGDHAGGWETSHLLASHPETVDLSRAAANLQYGIMSTRDPIQSTAEFGNEIYDTAAEYAIMKVRERLNHPELYQGHGMPLD
ncbi:MAG: creatininase family protein [Clostridiaceae bacterium]|nr:creatininase family protein [Clostridiaceae bacterium]